MRKIMLNYDENTNNIYGSNGIYVGAIPAGTLIHHIEVEPEIKLDIKDVIRLKEAGFDTKDIIELSKAGVL